MQRADELIPWKVTDISLRPHSGFWSMNPSIHFDGSVWRCVLRCTDYAMPGGVTIRSSRSEPGITRTKNVMVIFDPVQWKPTAIYKMREYDGLPRITCPCVGFEDVRIFRTDRGGLQGIAASLHLRRSDRPADPKGGFIKQPAEQVLLSFDDRYCITDAQPIRGSWSGDAQKNWAPFDHCAEPRFLYAIDKGTMFGPRGELPEAQAQVRPSVRDRRRAYEPEERVARRAEKRARESESDREREAHSRRRHAVGELPIFAQEPTHERLRGGTQLVRVADDAWLGVGHAMKFVDGRKFYWHIWYVVDARGKLLSASPAMKLAPDGIEFAAGIAVDGERVVVSFGVDDMECRIGETKLSAVMGILRPVT